MTTNIQQGSLLDVLKKKMRQTKEEMERYKDECEEYNKRLHAECMRREEVSITDTFWRFSVTGGGRRPRRKMVVSAPSILRRDDVTINPTRVFREANRTHQIHFEYLDKRSYVIEFDRRNLSTIDPLPRVLSFTSLRRADAGVFQSRIETATRNPVGDRYRPTFVCFIIIFFYYWRLHCLSRAIAILSSWRSRLWY
jgi:hypothetical protein